MKIIDNEFKHMKYESGDIINLGYKIPFLFYVDNNNIFYIFDWDTSEISRAEISSIEDDTELSLSTNIFRGLL